VQLKQLDDFILEAQLKNDLAEWRRGRAVRAYIAGRKVAALAIEAGVTRGSVNRWLQWYDADHVDGLRTRVAEGPAPKLTEEQRAALAVIIELGPIQAGYQSGVWTGPMIADLIEERFGVRYHNHHVSKLLHQLKFSVQRPHKRLARADLARQATWLRKTFPAIKKSAAMPRRRCLRGRSQLLAGRDAPPKGLPRNKPADLDTGVERRFDHVRDPAVDPC
jgi:transposase